MSAMVSILKLDARGVMRDNVMTVNILLSALVMVIITIVGLFKADTDWADWFPFMMIMSLMTGPAAYGFLFGLLMVDERDMGVRSVLAVTPVPQTRMLLMRTLTVACLMIVWPLFTYYVMNSTWQGLDFRFVDVLALVLMLSLAAPLTAMAVASYAQNKVEAIALFKGINFIILLPLALYFLPEDSAYREVFLILPSGWAVFAFEALKDHDTGAAYGWIVGGTTYHGILLFIAARTFIKDLYKASSA